MPNYQLEINEKISLEDYSVIHDYVSILEYKDKLTVEIKNNTKEEIDLICELLQNDHFNIINKNQLDRGGIAISAKKNI